MNTTDVAVLGSGITGLTVAARLQESGVDCRVFEAEEKPGGSVRTGLERGYLCEAGPNTMMVAAPEVEDFLRDMGLYDTALDAAPAARRRYVVQQGRLVALPSGPWSAVTTSVLSLRGKLRFLLEPWRPRGSDPDERFSTFVERRLGPEVLRELVGPFVSGIYAGDPARLVARHAFPRLYRLEKEHGSFIRGALFRKVSRRVRRRLVSWPEGLAALPRTLVGRLGERFLPGQAVSELRRGPGSFLFKAGATSWSSRRLVVAVPGWQVPELCRELADDWTPFHQTPFAPMVVVHLGFRRETVGHPLDGFGMLISRARGLRLLGALFSSTLFAGRAPDGHVLLTAFLGGRFDSEACALADQEILQTAVGELRPLLDIRGEPAFTRVTRWARAIPQYEENHGALTDFCRILEEKNPGLHLAGNYRGGISMGDCITNAVRLAETLKERA